MYNQYMNESPKWTSKLERENAHIEKAIQYLDSDNALMSDVLQAPTAMDARRVILDNFGISDDSDAGLSEEKGAILAEAITRWNKQRSSHEST